MFRVSATPIIRNTHTVTTAYGTGHIFCAATSLQRDRASLATLEGVLWLTPETCRVNLQNNK